MSADAEHVGSAEAAEELPHVTDEQVGCFQGCEVAAAVELRPVHDGVGLVGEAPDGDVGGNTATLVGTVERSFGAHMLGSWNRS